jgi:hypothetical protein
MDQNGVAIHSSQLTHAAGIANLAVGTIGVALFAMLRAHLAASFAAGYLLGVVNIYILLRLSRRIGAMDPAKAGGFMLRNYYIRFFVTALVLAVLIYSGLSPWALVAGVACSIFTTIAVIIARFREEAV